MAAIITPVTLAAIQAAINAGPGALTGSWIPRTNTRAALLALAGAGVGELASGTDGTAGGIPSIVQFDAVAGQAVAYLPSAIVNFFQRYGGQNSSNAIVTVGQTVGVNAPNLPGAAPVAPSISLVPGAAAGANYLNFARGPYDIVIDTSPLATTLPGGAFNFLFGYNNKILLGAAPNGNLSQGNLLFGSGWQISDGYSFGNAAIDMAPAGAISLTSRSVLIGRANGFLATAPATTAANLADENVLIGLINVVNSNSNALTAANTGKFNALIGSFNTLNGGTDSVTLIGAGISWGNLNHFDDGVTVIGSALLDSASNDAGNLGANASLTRMGSASIPNLGFGIEAIIDFLSSPLASGVNANLILLGSAKQYGSNPFNGAASARGNVAGGRGANVAFQFGFADQGCVGVAPLSGAVLTIPNACSGYHINPAGAIAALTVNMPAAPIEGQYMEISSRQAIAAFTHGGNGFAIDAPLTAMAQNQGAKWKFNKAQANLPANTWMRIQ